MKRIKFNWGTGIAIVIALFLLANAFVIYKSLQQRYDLVEKEYYPQGLEYQKQIDRFANAHALSSSIKIDNINGEIVITYPEEFKNQSISGKIIFFRPSDERADFADSIKYDSSLIQRVQTEKLMKGKYIAKFFWLMNQKEYAQESTFRLN